MSNDWLNIEQIIDSPDFKQWLSSRDDLNNDINKAANYFQVLLSLKKFYVLNEKMYLDNPLSWVSSYPYDWKQIMTPIEFEAWQTIRVKGRIIIYPQYPVLKYHVDFGNPALKIGLELDGAEYHNKERDLIRDTVLKDFGWTIYRITGKEMCRTHFKEIFDLSERDHEDNEIMEHLRYWLFETGDGVIQAIKEAHFTQYDNPPFESKDLNYSYYQLCSETLKAHQLIYG